jgi:hypothetical protein
MSIFETRPMSIQLIGNSQAGVLQRRRRVRPLALRSGTKLFRQPFSVVLMVYEYLQGIF